MEANNSKPLKVTAEFIGGLLAKAREIHTKDATPGVMGYAHALGQCNGLAALMIIELELLLESKGR